MDDRSRLLRSNAPSETQRQREEIDREVAAIEDTINEQRDGTAKQ